jgi:hypothetical protein
MLHYLKQHDTHVVPKICMKYFTVTGHVNKNWFHKEIFVCVMKESEWEYYIVVWAVREGSKEQEKA